MYSLPAGRVSISSQERQVTVAEVRIPTVVNHCEVVAAVPHVPSSGAEPFEQWVVVARHHTPSVRGKPYVVWTVSLVGGVNGGYAGFHGTYDLSLTDALRAMTERAAV